MGLLSSPLLFAKIRQPIQDVCAISDCGNGKSFAQKLLAPGPIPELGVCKTVAIRPSDPTPSPTGILIQPFAIEPFRLLSLAQFKERLCQCTPAVLRGQPIVVVKTP
jgi:hypothetical protein